jgi:predicted nucleotidyltransferase component of viral defense system
MNAAIEDLIRRRNPVTMDEYDRAFRESIQLVALLGLWRGKFFEHAAFYGGTALRILHGLPRFSEDIDFSLLRPEARFSLKPYLGSVASELAAYGLDCTVDESRRTSTAIESAFVKANTRFHLLRVAPAPELAKRIPRNQLLKVKVEVDTDPPGNFATEAVAVLEPIPFHVRTYVLPDLFAGKMHSVLCRGWSRRVKGRDWYDLIWYLQRETPVHLGHLEARMRQSGHWKDEGPLDRQALKKIYTERVRNVDFRQAASDVLPFIVDPRAVEAWDKALFLQLFDRIRFY